MLYENEIYHIFVHVISYIHLCSGLFRFCNQPNSSDPGIGRAIKYPCAEVVDGEPDAFQAQAGENVQRGLLQFIGEDFAIIGLRATQPVPTAARGMQPKQLLKSPDGNRLG